MAGIRRGGIGVTGHDGGPGDVGMEGNTDAKGKWSSWKTTWRLIRTLPVAGLKHKEPL